MFIRGSRSKDEHQQIKAKRRHPVIPRTGPASRMRNPIGLYKNVNKYGEEEEEEAAKKEIGHSRARPNSF